MATVMAQLVSVSQHRKLKPMQIERYTVAHRELWNQFVKNSKNGTFLFLRDYMDYHSDRFRDHSLLIRGDKSKLVALLPANQCGEVVQSHGGLTYGGFVTDIDMKAPKMLEVFGSTLVYLQQHGFTKFVYKTIPHIYHKVPAEEDRYALYLCHAKTTRRGVLTVIDTQHRLPFHERRARCVKRALKHGLVARPSNDLETYWHLLTRRLLETYNTHPVHTLEEIMLLKSRLPDHIKLFACYEGELMLAGVVIYESDCVAHVQYIAASERGKKCGALDLLFDYLTNEVYRQKPFFDFGTSDEKDGYYLNRGLIDQKEGFGARVIVHDHYEIDLAHCEPNSITTVME